MTKDIMVTPEAMREAQHHLQQGGAREGNQGRAMQWGGLGWAGLGGWGETLSGRKQNSEEMSYAVMSMP